MESVSRSALVTGVSRRVGIGWTVARRLAADGWTVDGTGWPPHDADDGTERFVAGRMPLEPRWGQPADTAELVAFLVSDAAGWITGQTIDSDGGWGIRSGVAGR